MKFVGLLAVFLTAHVEGSPKPKLVYPRLLEERSTEGRVLIHVHDDLTLKLRKASVAAPALRVLTENNGQRVTLFYNGEDINRNLYEDEVQLASVAVTRNEVGLHIKGLVSPQHRIEPLPVTERSHNGIVPHAIYEIEQDEMLDKALDHDEHERAVISERQNRWQPQPVRVPDNVTVEIFFILDSPHHSAFSTNKALLDYLCVMINSVNLRFGPTVTPNVKFMVTGMDISKNESYAVLYQHNDKYLFDEGTLRNLKGYVYSRGNQYGYPDVVYFMTGRDVYTMINGKFSVNGLGIGYISGVCTYSKVALGEDKPGLYTGTHTLTHELGHLTGAQHDGDAPAYSGHPGAKLCLWDDGNIMSYLNKGPSHHQFSRCSLTQIQYVIRRAGQFCWRVRSNGHVIPGQYPGTVVPSVAFCRDAINDDQAIIDNITRLLVTSGTRQFVELVPLDGLDLIINQGRFQALVHDEVSELTCKVQCSYYKLYQWKTSYGYSLNRKLHYNRYKDALDYMSCGDAKVCIQGVCVRKPDEESEATTKVYTTEASTNVPTTAPPVTGSHCRCNCNNAVPATPTTRWRPQTSRRNQGYRAG